MKKKVLAALIATVMVFSLSACQGLYPDKGKQDRADDGADSLSLPPKTMESETEGFADTLKSELSEDEEHELYNAYININNAMVGRIYDSLDRYFTYVDYESDEFKLLDENDGYYDCYSISSTIKKDVETAYDLVSKKSDKDALDQAFLDMYPYISSLLPILDEISDYTSPNKTYLEDGYAKSQEQHTALMSVVFDYLSTGDIFETELSAVAQQRHMENLEKLKADGYVVLYAINMVMDYAEEIEYELYYQGVWDDNILDMDLTTIQPLYDAFSTYVDTVLAYSEDADALRAEGLSSSGSLSIFIMNMKSTRESLSKVLAKVEAGKPLSQSDTMITSIAGQCNLSSFAEGLSDMIDSYNRLISY